VTGNGIDKPALLMQRLATIAQTLYQLDILILVTHALIVVCAGKMQDVAYEKEGEDEM
jgi:hypothetical protein